MKRTCRDCGLRWGIRKDGVMRAHPCVEYVLARELATILSRKLIATIGLSEDQVARRLGVRLVGGAHKAKAEGEERRALLRLLAKAAPKSDIARHLGISRQRIDQLVPGQGISFPSPTKADTLRRFGAAIRAFETRQRAAEFQAMWGLGFSLRKIAKEAGLSGVPSAGQAIHQLRRKWPGIFLRRGPGGRRRG